MIYVLAGTLVMAGLLVRWRLRMPSRRYEGPSSVSSIYDRWTREGVLEFYWDDHLHVGHYGDPPVRKDFVAAKIDLMDELIRWGLTEPCPAIAGRLNPAGGIPTGDPVRILDVGCGIGGSSRHLARRWPATARVTGVTISHGQAVRAAALGRTRRVGNARFLQGDALDLPFAGESIDVIWALESEPHIPDKERHVREMIRVLKPGGALILATWNVRDARAVPLSRTEREHVQYLLDEWCHAEFVSIPDLAELFTMCGLHDVVWDDWSAQTLPSWREALLGPVRNPRGLLRGSPSDAWRLARDSYTMLRLHHAFRTGLCRYGVIRGRKPGPGGAGQ